jgi:hypothetical protein
MNAAQRTGSSLRPAALTLAAALLGVVGCGGGGSEPPASPTNSAPSVALAGLNANQTFAAGAEILLRVDVADADGTVNKVEFFEGDTKLGEAMAAPFEYRWVGATTGSHTVIAKATDNGGMIATSGSLTVNVDPPVVPNAVPTVAVIAPTNAFKTNAPASLTWVAQAADSDGTVASVEFFRVDPAAIVLDDTTRVGTGTFNAATSAYELQTTNWAAGSHTVVARVTDDDGATATSATVQVIVNALPSVAFVAPTDLSSFVAGANITLRVAASDADGSIAKVEFFVDGNATPLGQGVQGTPGGNYELTWNAVPFGAHTIEARATDNDGTMQSTSISIGVDAPPAVSLAAPTVSGNNAPATITLVATATDSDGTIASVTFKNNGVDVGIGVRQGLSNDYQLVLANRPAGAYAFTATAVDDDGLSRTSDSSSVTVQPNLPPTVNVTSPASFPLPDAVVLTANAADSDGIAKVEFYSGAVKLGEDATAPYAFTWNGVAAGDYTVKARAIDNYGSQTDSAPMAVTVIPDPVGMWSTLIASQKAGFTQVPDREVGDPGVDAVEVLTAIGPNAVIPKFQPAMAGAVRALADFTPTTISATPQACPGGGTVLVSDNPATGQPDDLRYEYDACVVGAYTITGGTDYPHTDNTTVPPTVRNIGSAATYIPGPTGFKLVLEGVKVSGNGAPTTDAEAYPRNALVYSFADCTGTGIAKSCMTNLDVNALWGNAFGWVGYSNAGTPWPWTDDPYTLNGVFRDQHCPPDPALPNLGRDQCLANPPAARHIRYQAMTNVSGRAIVYGSNGYSVVTRLAPAAGKERVSIVRTITVATPGYPLGTSAAAVYECTVGASSGDWSCTPAP